MTEKIQKAIDKIDGEAEEIRNAYITSRVVQRIIDECLTTDENAEKLLDEKKTLQGCIMSIFENAKKQGTVKVEKGGAFVGGEDEDLWNWVCEYYGFAVDCKENKIVDIFDFI